MAGKKSTFGERLVRSARQAAEIARGEEKPAAVARYRLTARRASVEAPPQFDASRIRAIRERLAVSQRVFARALNVSDSTASAWEQGKREPEGPSRRLLELADRHPDLFRDMIHAGDDEAAESRRVSKRR